MGTRERLIEQLDKSGIPQAIASQKKIANIIVEFGRSRQGMAHEIIRLRELLNVPNDGGSDE